MKLIKVQVYPTKQYDMHYKPIYILDCNNFYILINVYNQPFTTTIIITITIWHRLIPFMYLIQCNILNFNLQ